MSLDIVSALKERPYRAVALGNAVSMVGIWMQKVAVGWLAWELSHSTAWLGAVAAADLLPAVFLSSVFGSLADGRNKAGLVLIAQIAAMVQSLVLAAITLAGVIDIRMLLVLTLALGVANSVDQPSRLSLLREIVQPRHLHSAITLNALSYHAARFVGPMVAGALISKADIGVTFLVSAATLGFFAVCLLRVPRPAAGSGHPRPTMLGGTSDGYRYILSNLPIRRAMTVMVIFGAGVGGVNQLLPALADRLFGRGVDGFVELTVASGLGAVASGIVLLTFPPRRAFPRMSGGLVGAALALVVFACASSYWVGICALFAASFASTQAGVVGQGMLNSESRPDMLGRVMGVYSAVIRGAPAAGGFLMGVLAPYAGFGVIILACAACTGLYGLFLMRAARKRPGT